MKIKINGQVLDYFNDVSIETNLDAVASTFAFTTRFDPEENWHKKLFRPLSFPRVEFLADNGRPLSTGTIINHNFSSSEEPQLIKLSGYSLGGILEDCNIPHELYPLESNNRSLKEIAQRLLKYFNLNLVVYDIVAKDCGVKIPKSVAAPEDTVASYLCKIAAQKNVVVSHDVYGNIIFFRPDIKGKPKAFFNQSNTLDMELEFNGQGMHSVITNLRQPNKSKTKKNKFSLDDDGPLDIGTNFDDIDKPKTNKGTGKITSTQLSTADSAINHLVTANRPKIEVLTSGTDGETQKGAKNTMAAELKNIALSFGFKTWEPYSIGDIIEVQNPELFLYKRTRWMIASTTITEGPEGRALAVQCVLPETFTGDTPQRIFE